MTVQARVKGVSSSLHNLLSSWDFWYYTTWAIFCFVRQRPLLLLLAFHNVLTYSWCYCQFLCPLLLLYLRELLRAGVRWPTRASGPFWWSRRSSRWSARSVWRPSQRASWAIRWPTEPSRWTSTLLMSLQYRSCTWWPMDRHVFLYVWCRILVAVKFPIAIALPSSTYTTMFVQYILAIDLLTQGLAGNALDGVNYGATPEWNLIWPLGIIMLSFEFQKVAKGLRILTSRVFHREKESTVASKHW